MILKSLLRTSAGGAGGGGMASPPCSSVSPGSWAWSSSLGGGAGCSWSGLLGSGILGVAFIPVTASAFISSC